jgi:hypothetical protein
MRVLAAVLAAALLPAACEGESAPLKGPLAYRTTVVVDIIPDPQDGCGEKPPESTEWVAPTTGSFRSEGMDCSGSDYLRIYSNGRYLSSLAGQPTSVRIGSRAFIGSNADESASLQVIASAGDPQVGDVLEWTSGNGLPYSVTVEEVVPLAEAQRRGLFDVQVERADFIDRQLKPGAKPTLPMKAYWFGPRIAGLRAFVASELRNDDGLIYITCYGNPAEISAGKTHCLPSRDEPTREVQVVSQTVTGKLAKRELARLEGTGPGRRIRLANREDALLYRGAVVTSTTLITLSNVAGKLSLRRQASKLRPL